MFNKTITKKIIGDKVHESLGFSKNFSRILIDNILQLLFLEFKSNKNVKIASFGTFKLIDKKERIGRNPKTKIVAKISARRVVSFHPSKEFKKKLNKKINV